MLATIQILRNKTLDTWQPICYIQQGNVLRVNSYHPTGYNIREQAVMDIQNVFQQLIAGIPGLTEISIAIEQDVEWSGIGKPYDILLTDKVSRELICV